MGVPENFHGVVGKSGRKTAWEEHNKVSAINKLWEKVNNKVMAGEQLSEYEEKLVLSILPKTIKTETDITSGDKPLPLLQYVLNNNGNEKDNGNDGENTNSIGGDISVKVDIDSLISDSPSTERQGSDTN